MGPVATTTRAAGGFIAGATLWTLAEYGAHRFLMHGTGRGPIATEHLMHHAEPERTQPWLRTAGYAATFAAAGAGIRARPSAAFCGIAIGLVAGFTAYESFHWRAHHRRGWRWEACRRVRHFAHHFSHPGANYGVTTPVWDRLFGTYERAGRVVVPRRLAMPWLLDGTGSVAAEHRADYVVASAHAARRSPGCDRPGEGVRQPGPRTVTRARDDDRGRWIEPMLATLVPEPFSDPEWIFEKKHDGIRGLAHRIGGDVRLYTRNRNPIDNAELTQALRAQPGGDFVLDGEIVGGHFGGESERGYHVFDVMVWDGVSTCELTTLDRLALLRTHVDWRDPLVPVSSVSDDGEALYAEAVAGGWEGIVAKRSTAPYRSGRTREWRKIKCTASQELVIGGFTEPKGSRVGLGAVLVGHFDNGELRYAGKVGTGFTDEMLVELRQRLDELEIEVCPFAERVRVPRPRWVRPEVVAEVQFMSWTPDGRLRHPSFKGLRADKMAGDVRREA